MSEQKLFLEQNSKINKVGEDGFYQLHFDVDAIQSYQAYIDKRMVKFKSRAERFQWLADNHYYYAEMLQHHTMADLLLLDKFVYSFPFEWESFMAISKFYKSYAMKTNKKKKILETYQDRILIDALYLAQGNIVDAYDFVQEMITQNYQPATPTFQNGGRARRGEMISCFLTEVDDSLNAITFNWRMTADLSKKGGGVSNNLSKMRAKGEAIKEIEGAASGVIKNMKINENISSYINQLGQRDGAFADYLHINHPDFLDFLDVKKIAADESLKMTKLSLGAIVPSIFFDRAFEDKDWHFFYPLSVYQAYGIHMDDMDMDEMYEVLLADERVRKEKSPLNCRELLNKIATMQIESGYPYIMYKSNANRQHPLKRLGQVKFSNLCTEIFQLSEVSEYNDYDQEDAIKYDIQCCLGSLNIKKLMKSKRIPQAVDVATRMLTSVLDLTNIPNAPAIMKANRDLNAIGIGFMNLMGYLAEMGIPYEHEDAREFADKLAFIVNYHSLQASMNMAVKKGRTFVGFEESDYADGSYFDYQGYLVDDYREFKAERVKDLFDGIDIPSPEDCRLLMEQIKENGLYHAYRMAIAPTQSISYIQNSTSSIMPNTQIIEARSYGDSMTYFPMPGLSRKTYHLYWKTAYNMNQKRIIDMVAVFQKHVDQGISCILFVEDTIPTEELAHLIAYAHYKGLKSLYYVRTKNTSASECEACAV